MNPRRSNGRRAGGMGFDLFGLEINLDPTFSPIFRDYVQPALDVGGTALFGVPIGSSLAVVGGSLQEGESYQAPPDQQTATAPATVAPSTQGTAPAGSYPPAGGSSKGPLMLGLVGLIGVGFWAATRDTN